MTDSTKDLTAREYFHGVEHSETRTLDQIISDRIDWRVKDIRPKTLRKEMSAGDRFLANSSARREPMPMDEYRRSFAEELDRRDAEKKSLEQLQQEFDSEPGRAEARKTAQADLDRLKYDRTATQRDVQFAEYRLNLAEYGSMDLFHEAQQQHEEEQTAKHQEAIDVAQARVDEATAELEALQ